MVLQVTLRSLELASTASQACLQGLLLTLTFPGFSFKIFQQVGSATFPESWVHMLPLSLLLIVWLQVLELKVVIKGAQDRCLDHHTNLLYLERHRADSIKLTYWPIYGLICQET